MSRYKDFDAFFAEQEKEPVTFTLFGEKHVLPAAMPASIVLKLIRLQKDYGSENVVPNSELIEMAVDVFGEDRVQAWTKKGLDIDQLGELIKWTMEQYTGQGEEDPNEEATKE